MSHLSARSSSQGPRQFAPPNLCRSRNGSVGAFPFCVRIAQFLESLGWLKLGAFNDVRGVGKTKNTAIFFFQRLVCLLSFFLKEWKMLTTESLPEKILKTPQPFKPFALQIKVCNLGLHAAMQAMLFISSCQ